MGGYYAKSHTDGVDEENDSYLGRAAFDGDRYGATAQYLKIGDNFAPDIGLVRRDNMRRSFGSLRFSPRPRVHFKDIRQFTYSASIEYIENAAGERKSTRLNSSHLGI